MKICNEIITKSFIDFEEIKFILANNNIELIKSYELKESYFLNEKINFKTADINKIIENSYILSEANKELHLLYVSKKDIEKKVSKIRILDKNECVEFLNHTGFQEKFCIEKNVYVYIKNENMLSIINLIGIGFFIKLEKPGASIEELKAILNEFYIPYDEENCNISIEKKFIDKIRRKTK